MMTRPDLAFAFAELSKFVQAPGEVHLNRLRGWVDSDYAADPDTRRSTSGYLRHLLRDLGYAQRGPTTIFEDNAFEAFFVDVGAMKPSFASYAWRTMNSSRLACAA
mmetsp:Transcript_63864/g.133031  ORF Transcript_63864/g.133031 Transcript_63864/m.133031 type:complete len:106 (-) Transcript_63864:45-362(-)